MDEQQVRAHEEEAMRLRAEEEEKRRKQEMIERSRSVRVTRERLRDPDGDSTDAGIVRAASMPARAVRPKPKRPSAKQRRVDEVAEFMNRSADSEAMHSATNYNILDERATPAPVQVQHYNPH